MFKHLCVALFCFFSECLKKIGPKCQIHTHTLTFHHFKLVSLLCNSRAYPALVLTVPCVFVYLLHLCAIHESMSIAGINLQLVCANIRA